MTYNVTINGNEYEVEMTPITAAGSQGEATTSEPSQWQCTVGGRVFKINVSPASAGTLSLLVDGRSCEIRSDVVGNESYVVVDGKRYSGAVRDPRQRQGRRALTGIAGPAKLLAPMPGKIVTLLVSQGDEVEAGQGIMVIEAMKMQNELKSPKTGKVQKLLAAEGGSVNTGDVLAIIE